ncbi:MAG: DUF4298 domain-containing protein [Bacteroidaceae bacterium]|nr:DUF4298 domain-containing protein [Bacteroidaceae bacterium]
MKQIERIKQMEERFERASKAIKKLSSTLDNYAEVQEDLAALSKYYGSKDWKKDFNDDEAGRLPQDLKRGVLSEDGIWNLLEANKELREALQKIVQN